MQVVAGAAATLTELLSFTVLGPSHEGFSPTPEMPEIAEAQTLLGGLSNPRA